MEQINIFDCLYPTFKIDKPIRLIELFAGIGSQAMALRDLGADFEHHRVVEFDRFAIASYNAIHGTDFPTMDITKIKGQDLAITDIDHFTYLLTYSFPCQDLSVAGRQKGMTKGSGTRSGLLWEVERLLNEVENLPQVLLMENVPQVHSEDNMQDFQKWIDFLTSKGYSNYWEDLNAKDYGVAQNRKRCFMVSILGEYNYKFPQPILLTKTMKDYLEDEVDEKYYINSEKAQKLIKTLICECNLNGCIGNVNPSGNGINGNVYAGELAPTITTNKGEGAKVCVNMSFITPKIISEASTITAKNNRGLCETFKQADDWVIECRNRLITCKLDKMPDGKLTSLNKAKICDVGTETASTITARYHKGIGAHKDNMLIVAMRGRNPDNPSDGTVGAKTEQRLEANSQGICNTLTSVQKDNMLVEKVKIKQATKDGFIECKVGGVADLSYPNSKTRRGRVQDGGDTSPTITATETGICRIEQYRIRKLTPLECWRLMEFSDEDFLVAKLGSREEAQKLLEQYPHLGKRAFTEAQRKERISNSQLYKQAGNSIVKLVLMAILGQMLEGKKDLYKTDK